MGGVQSPPAYILEARLDPAAHEVAAQLALRFTNDGDRPLPALWFQLYPNIFRPGSTYMLRPARRSTWTPSSPTAATRAGSPFPTCRYRPSRSRPSSTTPSWKCPLRRPLQPGETVTLQLAFHSHCPGSLRPLRPGGRGLQPGLLVPAPGRPRPRRLDLTPHTAPVQELHDQHADFEVKFTLPARFTVGATGHLASKTRVGDDQVLRYQAHDVRGFALEASPGWTELASTQDGVTVHVLARPGGGLDRAAVCSRGPTR